MANTAQTLAEDILVELEVADATDRAASPTDIEDVKRRYAGVLAEMADDGLVFWDYDAIPDRVMPALTEYMAFRCRKQFGRPDYPLDDALARLQRLAVDTDRALPVKTVYF